jgi:hypothetical protein
MWIKMVRQHISQEVIVKGFKKRCISSAVGLMMIHCGMTVKMDTVTLIGKSRQNLTCFVYCV